MIKWFWKESYIEKISTAISHKPWLLAHNIIPVIQSVLYVSQKSERKKFNSKARKLNALLRSYANENKIEFVGINEVLSVDGTLIDELTYDGTHLVGQGYIKWRDKILPVISKYVN